MAKEKVKQEKVTAGVCVCGRLPCTTKHKRLWLVACPDGMACAMRGTWQTNEQAAIKSWNDAVTAAKHERSQKNGSGRI